MNTSVAGKTGGITLTLNTLVDEYTTGPTSYSEGFSVCTLYTISLCLCVTCLCVKCLCITCLCIACLCIEI